MSKDKSRDDLRYVDLAAYFLNGGSLKISSIVSENRAKPSIEKLPIKAPKLKGTFGDMLKEEFLMSVAVSGFLGFQRASTVGDLSI